MKIGDRLLRRDTGYWEGLASGAAVLTTTYGSPDREQILPQFADWAKRAFKGNGVVFSAFLTRVMLLSEAVFQFQALDDKHLFGNESLSILERPWPNGTSGELIARMEQDSTIAGNAYIWKVPGEELLVRKRPDWMTIVSEVVRVPGGGSYRQKTGYWFQDPAKVAQGRPQDGEFYPADEVAHWVPTGFEDPYAEFRGMSWMTPVVRDIAGDDGMNQYKIKYLENAATPNMLIKYAARLQPGTVDSIRERLAARHGGVDNAYKTIVLDQGADMTLIGSNMQQADFSNVMAAGEQRILAASMVPGVLVGLEPLRGAGRGYQESMQKLANIWARPTWRSLCGCLEQLCPPPGAGSRLWFDTGDIAALQDGELERGQAALVNMQAILTATQAGASLESAVAAVSGADYSLLKPNPVAAPVPAGNVQHMLPQAQPGAVATPLPPTGGRIAIGPASPGYGGDNKRPAPQPSAARRAITAAANGHGK